jgi:hypothetical protein
MLAINASVFVFTDQQFPGFHASQVSTGGEELFAPLCHWEPCLIHDNTFSRTPWRSCQVNTWGCLVCSFGGHYSMSMTASRWTMAYLFCNNERKYPTCRCWWFRIFIFMWLMCKLLVHVHSKKWSVTWGLIWEPRATSHAPRAIGYMQYRPKLQAI